MKNIFFGAAFAALSSCYASPIMAQEPRCADSQQVVDYLKNEYGEAPVFAGIVADGVTAITVFANEETGTSSVLAVRADGITCAIADGVGFQILENK